MSAKPCTLCGSQLPPDAFYAARTRDGLANQCKACVKGRARNRRLAKIEEIRTYDRQRNSLPHRVIARVQRFQKFKAEHPERRAAHNAVNNAVRDGRLRKMDCAFCGGGETVAHHHDYAKPLDVTWLCTPCHLRFHALESMSNYERPATLDPAADLQRHMRRVM